MGSGHFLTTPCWTEERQVGGLELHEQLEGPRKSSEARRDLESIIPRRGSFTCRNEVERPSQHFSRVARVNILWLNVVLLGRLVIIIEHRRRRPTILR
jgi:hypothetical protein